ncbi:hypothetical protein [Streptomyces rochei]|uniref:hypothetical protein n=1 Tax=Streptomyces rochei TaxID=1928 RepID=UPI003625F554
MDVDGGGAQVEAGQELVGEVNFCGSLVGGVERDGEGAQGLVVGSSPALRAPAERLAHLRVLQTAITRCVMADASGSDPAKKITDYDLARLVRQGVDDLAADPDATEIRERIWNRENLEEDRDHRARSDSSAVIGFTVGMAILIVLIVVSIATFEP